MVHLRRAAVFSSSRTHPQYVTAVPTRDSHISLTLALCSRSALEEVLDDRIIATISGHLRK